MLVCEPLQCLSVSIGVALVGGIWLMWWMGFNASVAVAVGFIALAGVAAEPDVSVYRFARPMEVRSHHRPHG